MTTRGLILFAHGARDARWSAPFEALACAVQQQRPGLALRLAYLEFMAPDLTQAGVELCAAGCTQVEVLPVFLGTGGHLRKDLPPMVEGLRQRFPQVLWTLHAAVGEHPVVLQAMAAAALSLLTADGAAHASDA